MQYKELFGKFTHLSYDVRSGSKIMPSNKIDKPLVITSGLQISGNVMKSMTKLRT